MLNRNGFQNAVNTQLPPAVAGDFAGASLRAFAPGGPKGFVADTAGVIVGRFAWGNPVTGLAANVQAANTILGFVHREQGVALITTFLDYFTETIRGGLALSLMTRGQVWARFPAGAAVGLPVYVDPATGIATTTVGSNVLTPFYVVTPVVADSAFTGVVDANGILTVSAPSGGPLSPGQQVTGTGVAANTFIVAQMTGTVGGAGTYQLSYRKAVTSASMTATAGKLAKISTWQVA